MAGALAPAERLDRRRQPLRLIVLGVVPGIRNVHPLVVGKAADAPRELRRVAAEALLAANPGARLVADHAIPVSLSLREFECLEQPSLDALVALVARYAVMVLITLDEDARLRAAGLVKAMPSDWDGQELLARYRQVGIPIKPGQALQLK